jgi:hypothetical protein
MIGKIISDTGKNEKAALLKNSVNNEDGKKISSEKLFQSLLNSLKGEGDEEANQDVLADLMSGEGATEFLDKDNDEGKDEVLANVLMGNISNELSGSNPENENLKKEMKQLLQRLKQSEQGPVSKLQNTGEMETESNEVLNNQLMSLLKGSTSGDNGNGESLVDHLSETEITALKQALSSDRVQTVAANLSQVLSDKSLNDKDLITRLKRVLNKLGQEGQSRLSLPGEADSDVSNAGVPKKEEADISGKNGDKVSNFNESVKEIKGQEKAIEDDKPAEQKEDPVVNNRGKEKEIRSTDRSVDSFSGKENKERVSQSQSEQMASRDKTRTERFSTSERKAVADREATQKGMKITEKQREIIDGLSLKSTSAGASEKGLEMKSALVDKDRKKENNNAENRFLSLTERVEGRGNTFSGRVPFSGTRNPGEFSQPNTAGSSNGSVSQENATFLMDGEDMIWKEHTADSVESNDDKETIQQNASSSAFKLGQVPIANGSLRKRILPALTQSVLKAASEAKKNPENWQKHNFVLDDGKKLQLSVREAKGVLQVKLGAMNLDLSKLLQQNMQQIREHLKQEFGSQIDLQFEQNGQEDTASQFSDSSSASHGGKGDRAGIGGSEVGSEEAEKANFKAVRNFGYNQMEWTA